MRQPRFAASVQNCWKMFLRRKNKLTNTLQINGSIKSL